MTVVLEPRNVYGEVKLYPLGSNAEHIRALTGHKTVNANHLKALRALGFTVEFTASVPAWAMEVTA